MFHPAVRIYEIRNVAFRRQPHRLRVTHPAAIRDLNPVVAHNAISHRRKIRFRGDLRCLYSTMAPGAWPHPHMLLMAEMSERRGPRLLDRRVLMTLRSEEHTSELQSRLHLV